MKNTLILPVIRVIIIAGFCLQSFGNLIQAQHSVARQWNEALLNSVRNDFARPTVHARNLWHTSIALYDAWAVYTPAADCFFVGDTVGEYYCPFNGINPPADIRKAQEKAMSYAAYRLIKFRFQNSPGSLKSMAYIDSLFNYLGYNPADTSTNYSTGSPAALGNYIAKELIFFGYQDNSNEQNSYANAFYTPVNPALAPIASGNPSITDPNRWQPLSLDVFIDQSGNVIPITVPAFLGPEWGAVVPFALDSNERTTFTRNGNDYEVYFSPPSPPYLDTANGGQSSENYKWNFRLVSKWSSHLDTADGVTLDISPASLGNTPFYPKTMDSLQYFYDEDNGGDPGTGYSVNPATGQPYAPQIVKRGDYTRVLAEFWADGPDSETPPGHWFTILNYVSDNPQFQKRWNGQGPVLDDLEWDVKSYFTLAGAMHDAAVTAWGLKGWYDYIRPVSALRYLGDQGQGTDPNLPNYSINGIHLDSGYVELVDSLDPLVGANYENLWKIKVFAWAGPDSISNPATDMAGVNWILLENWWPYQRPTFVTPPFAGYVSGHSTFSRAAAEVMTSMTGDAYFPGGMGEFIAAKNDFLVFEEGPSQTITLQWATYRDASDQCSLSRIWGGIHPPADDMPGRLLGMRIGNDAYDLAVTYWENGIPDVMDITTNVRLINDTLAQKQFQITVSFDEFMDTTFTPVVGFPVENPLLKTLSYDSANSGWLNKYTYVSTYNVADSNETLWDIDISVSGGRAPDGTLQAMYNVVDRFHIDMENPFITFTANPSIVADANVGAGGSSIVLHFNEIVLGNPQINFPADDPTLKTLSLDSANTYWLDSVNYQITFNVVDSNEYLNNIDLYLMSVSDTNGNERTASIVPGNFSVDMENPWIVSATPSVDTIQIQHAGTFFNLTVNYSEGMDTNLSPQLSFPVEDPLAKTLSFEPLQSYWLTDSIYVAAYSVDSAFNTLYDIDLEADWAEDRVGNLQMKFLLADLFSIDIKSGIGLKDLSVDPEFKLYPNPVQQGTQIMIEFNPELHIAEMLLMDETGKMVMMQSLPAGASVNKVIVNSEQLAVGSYILQLRGASTILHQKLIVVPK